MRELTLKVEPRMLPIFLPVLQDGFLLEARVGCSIREFLRDQCGIPHETITDRISTVFLDGMPVDDLDLAYVKDESTVALSGAMPGLMGATMRIDSPFRSFRDTISHVGDQHRAQPHVGMVRLKLFNTVMSELGHRFLRDGIVVDATTLNDLLTRQMEKGSGGFAEILLDGRRVDMNAVLDERTLSRDALVSVSVEVHE